MTGDWPKTVDYRYIFKIDLNFLLLIVNHSFLYILLRSADKLLLIKLNSITKNMKIIYNLKWLKIRIFTSQSQVSQSK